jgi:hypothetical protein
MRLKPDMDLIIPLPSSPHSLNLDFSDNSCSSAATSVTEEDIGLHSEAMNVPNVIWEQAPVNESLTSGHFFKTPSSPNLTYYKSNTRGLFKSGCLDNLSSGHLSGSDNSKPSMSPVLRNNVHCQTDDHILEERTSDEPGQCEDKGPPALSGSTTKQRKSPSQKRAAKVRFADDGATQETLPNIEEGPENGEGDSETIASPDRATTGGKSIQPVQTPHVTKRKSARNGGGRGRVKRSRKSPYPPKARGAHD